MEVFGEVYLSYSDSQRFFGEFRTKVRYKITNADLIAKKTMGMVFFRKDEYGEFHVKDEKGIHIPCRLTNENPRFYSIREKIMKRILGIIRELAINNKTTEVEFDASKIFDDELEKEIEENVVDLAMT